MRTQVGIVGAGPAGLTLAHLLQQRGIDCVLLEARSRSYVESRVRAGVLEQNSVDLLHEICADQRLRAECLVHHGVELGFRARRHHIPMTELTGKSVTVYGQHEVVKDLIRLRLAAGHPILFDVQDVTIHDFDADQRPRIHFTSNGKPQDLHCDYIAGCDGFHGICRQSVPASILTTYERAYPFAWLGILAEAPPSQQELVYMHHDRGFALFSMRSPQITRLYLQCHPEEDLAKWSDDRIWSELLLRFTCEDGWHPNQGPILQKSVTPMRSFTIEPMQFGRLFLAGDAAHIVPPTGAKGMNLALADVEVLAHAVDAFYKTNATSPLAQYSDICLRRVWKVQRFSWWMTSMLHIAPDANPFDLRRQLAELDYVTSSRAAALSLAENYVGMPKEWTAR
jgi:p-hydroxybenzoate 3-monooxygenase